MSNVYIYIYIYTHIERERVVSIYIYIYIYVYIYIYIRCCWEPVRGSLHVAVGQVGEVQVALGSRALLHLAESLDGAHANGLVQHDLQLRPLRVALELRPGGILGGLLQRHQRLQVARVAGIICLRLICLFAYVLFYVFICCA